jgi:hypothetical protein
MDENEDLSKVEVMAATCSKCNGVIHLAVKHKMDRAICREYGKYLEDGCNIHTINVIVARTAKWCQEPCEGMWPKKTKKKKNENNNK